MKRQEILITIALAPGDEVSAADFPRVAAGLKTMAAGAMQLEGAARPFVTVTTREAGA